MARFVSKEPWLSVRKVIELFVAMGCEPQEFPGQDVAAFADWTVRYLYDRASDRFVDLSDFDLDDRVAPSTLETWERVLGVSIPRPGDFN
ncbi:MAG TPA: hypothetical protein VII63_08520 [Caulobacteraceae bacterium]